MSMAGPFGSASDTRSDVQNIDRRISATGSYVSQPRNAGNIRVGRGATLTINLSGDEGLPELTNSLASQNPAGVDKEAGSLASRLLRDVDSASLTNLLPWIVGAVALLAGAAVLSAWLKRKG
jgi:hypothetical protein